MRRSVIIGSVCTAYLILSATSSVAQELLDNDRDLVAGRRIFNNACRTCHTTSEGDNRLGPNLYKIIGRKAGSLPSYEYSSAMKGADFIWDEANLNRFIANPDEMVPGNNMKPYGGLASADDRVKVIPVCNRLRPVNNSVLAFVADTSGRRETAVRFAAVHESVDDVVDGARSRQRGPIG